MPTKRKSWSALHKQEIIARQENRCKICKEIFGEGERVEYDHMHPLASGGKDELDNLQALCKECHQLKTFHPRSKATTLAADIFEIAKGKRLAKKQSQPRKPATMKSRGFSKKFKRKMDGTVIKND